MLLFSKSECSMKVSEWQSQRPLLRFSYQGGWANKCLSSALAKCVMWEYTHMKDVCSEDAGLAAKTHLPGLPLPPVSASIFISSKKHSPSDLDHPQSEPIFMSYIPVQLVPFPVQHYGAWEPFFKFLNIISISPRPLGYSQIFLLSLFLFLFINSRPQ